MQGDIFKARGATADIRVPFAEAFPEIERVQVDLEETGEGNRGLGLRRFEKRSVREFINCSNQSCAGIGLSLGELLRDMANRRQARARIEKSCESQIENGCPCPNRFALDVSVTYHSDSRDSPNPFGVLAFFAWNHPWNNHHFSVEQVTRATRLLQEANIGWVRMDFLWSDLEPRPHHFDFAHYDALVNAVRDSGRCVLGVLHYNPRWRNGPWNQPPDPTAYSQYAAAVVTHFKDRVGFWEIWNEPDHPYYWSPQDDLLAYSRLLKQAYAAVKRSDPSARVLQGGLAMELPTRMRRIYDLAGRDSFDVGNIHPFVPPGQDALLEETCRHVRSVMNEFSDDKKPLWATEIGCPGVPENRSKGWWLGSSVSEVTQAAWLEKVYSTCLESGSVQKVFWAFLRDTTDHFKDDVDFFGLLRDDLSPKPAFEVFGRLASGKK